MGDWLEIYLTKKTISSDDANNFIKIISNYNGIFRTWKLVIINNKNKIRFFIKPRCALPITISKLDFCMFKKSNEIKIPNTIGLPFFIKDKVNVIELINYCGIKRLGNLKIIEIDFRKVTTNNVSSKINFYVKKNNEIKKFRLFGNSPESILEVNFDSNKRYFYRSAPKYLDISKCLHLLSSDKVNSNLKIDTFPYLQGDYFLKQNSYSFDKHSMVIGSSGCGKSKFISLMIENVYKNRIDRCNYKVVVIDPHVALEDDIGGLGKVIDFKNIEDSIDLFLNKNDDIVSSCELLLDLFKSLIADQYNSKLERVLRHSIYVLLMEENFSFSSLRKIILELDFRNELIRKLKNSLPSSVIDFFLNDFNELKTKSYSEAISPIISFIDEMEILPVFNESNNIGNLKNTINNNFLTIFSLDKTKLGDKVTKTIAGLVMQQLLILIQSHSFKEHIIFIIDEVAVVENNILARYLSEARKYNLSLVLASQYFNQISSNLRNAIFANVSNYYIFRVSMMDANILVDNINMKIPLDNSKEQKIKLLTELKVRDLIVRIDSNGLLLPAFKASTLDFISIPRKRIIINKKKKIEKTLNKKKNNFSIDSSVNLKDILIKSSSSRKAVK